MAENPQDVHVSNYFRVSAAPVGTTLPTDVLVPAKGPTPEVSNLDPAFKQLGFTSPDGSLFRIERTTEGIPVHQQQGFVRILETEIIQQIQTVFREYSRPTWEMAFGGGTWSTVGGVTRYDPPAMGHVQEQTVVLDSIDGDVSIRLVLERTMVTSGTESAFQRNAASDLPVTIDALIPGGGRSNFYFLIDGAPGLVSA